MLLDQTTRTGLRALQTAVLSALPADHQLAVVGARDHAAAFEWMRTEADAGPAPGMPIGSARGSLSVATPEVDRSDRIVALVDLARAGDAEAFGQLYDNYVGMVHRFLYYRLGSQQLAEDLTSETFFRALRAVSRFRWQGKDFGAWLITIARNLTSDHYKSSRYRLESTTDEITRHDVATAGLEDEVVTAMSNEVLLDSLRRLPAEQQDCLVLRFLQGRSIAETARALGRSVGATKQLQLRAVRRLAKTLPDGFS